ncbi:MAG: hypothetical protein IT463_08930 [Planctomycetes bacterium]|nr:hypothetical protein [Planctomycetota bacterium]
MKTILAAVVAGVIGSGATVAALTTGLVALPASDTPANQPRVAAADPAESTAATGGDVTAELASLRAELQALRATQEQAQPAAPAAIDMDALVKTVREELKKDVIAAPASPAGVTGSTSVPAQPADPNFDTAVRGVIERMQAEQAETRRLGRQAERVSELETAKQRVAETIPKFVESQAQRMNLTPEQVTAVSNTLVGHLQARADLASERQGLRIDDQQVDDEAFKARFEQLDQATLAALGTSVDAATADSLLKAANRAGEGGGRNEPRGPQGRRGR